MRSMISYLTIFINHLFLRNKSYLFDDQSPNFFSPADRARIIEFVLKRQRYSDDPGDPFAFGNQKNTDLFLFLRQVGSSS